MSVSYGGDSITFADGSVQSGGWTGFKNRIINGAMTIDQRNAGAAITAAANVYTVDRFLIQGSQTGKFNTQQVADAPSGFLNSLKFTVGTAVSVGSTDYFIARQAIEGNNIVDLGFGTASASTVTLSFWVKSSITGTHSGHLTNATSSRWYPFTYTISQANTWEKETITIPGDITGTWGTGTGVGIYVGWSLGTGSSNETTANAWSASTGISATGSVDIVATSGATFQITGVQFERGSTASSFEYRPYTTELQLCQRYFITDLYAWVGGGATPASANRNFATSITFPVTMRSTPVIEKTGTETRLLMNAGTFDFITPQHTRYIATNSAANDCYAYTTFNAAIEL